MKKNNGKDLFTDKSTGKKYTLKERFQKHKKPILTGVGIGVIGVLGYTSHFFLGDDNPVEQASEWILKKSGVPVEDFTP